MDRYSCATKVLLKSFTMSFCYWPGYDNKIGRFSCSKHFENFPFYQLHTYYKVSVRLSREWGEGYPVQVTLSGKEIHPIEVLSGGERGMVTLSGLYHPFPLHTICLDRVLPPPSSQVCSSILMDVQPWSFLPRDVNVRLSF